MIKNLIILIVVAVMSVSAFAAKKKQSNTITMDNTTISGDKELPQVLYVVPWQDAKDDELYQPVVGYDDGLKFIDQKEFGRETSYSQQLHKLQ